MAIRIAPKPVVVHSIVHAPCTGAAETALYRHFDRSGRLLYVGISLSVVRRLSEHGAKPWARDIASVTIEKFQTREGALAAEMAAIGAEEPMHNIVGVKVHTSLRTSRYGEDRYRDAEARREYRRDWMRKRRAAKASDAP